MKFKIVFDPKTKRLYVPPFLGVIIILAVLALSVGIAAFFLITRWNIFLSSPEDALKPLGKLGTAPKDVKGEAIQDAEKASDAILAQIKRDYGNRFTIIFFYDGYETQNMALTDIKILQTALEGVEPFKSLKDLVAYKIFTTEGEKCEVKSDTEQILVCDERMLDSFQRLGIDHFKLVILSRKKFLSGSIQGRGANSWISLSTDRNGISEEQFRRGMGVTFLRQIGHSLGLKSEMAASASAFLEFVPPTKEELGMKSYKSGQPNCAPDLATAQKWWGNYVGKFPEVAYFSGCAGNKNYIFPIENTLMSDNPQKESFGKVSEDYLRGVISCFYAGKEEPIFGAGKTATYSAALTSCDSFTKQFPEFWEE